MDPLLAIRKLGRTARFKAGERIYSKGMPAHEAYIVTFGEVLATGASADGREVVFYRMGPDYGLGPLTALCGGVYDNDCVARSDCELIVIKAAEARELLRKDHDLTLYLLEEALARLRRRMQRWEDTSILSAGARLCKWLVDYASKNNKVYDGSVLELDESERIIGLSLGGVSRESVSRGFAALAQAGVIARRRKTLQILNVATLHALASGALPFPYFSNKAKDDGYISGAFDRRAPTYANRE